MIYRKFVLQPHQKKYTGFVSSLVFCPFHCYSTLTIIVSLSHFVVSIVITFRRFHPQPFRLCIIVNVNCFSVCTVCALFPFSAMPPPRQKHPQGMPRRAHQSRVAIPRNGTLVQQERNYIYDELAVMCTVRKRRGCGNRSMAM